MAAEGSSNKHNPKNLSMTDSPDRPDTSNVPSIFTGNLNRPINARLSKTFTSIDDSATWNRPPKVRSNSLVAAADSDSTQLSPDATDRVFPIRSYVSVDPKQTPTAQSTNKSEEKASDAPLRRTSRNTESSTPGTPSLGGGIVWGESNPSSAGLPFNANDETVTREYANTGASVRNTSVSVGARQHYVGATGQGYQLPADNASIGSGSVTSSVRPSHNPPFKDKSLSMTTEKSVQDIDETGGLVTARFKHVVTDEGHAVITGRDGDTLQRCEDEPIHIPGAVQSFGMLLALEETKEGRLVVRVVSENSNRVIGYSPKQLFALSSFTDILSEEQADNLLDHVDFIKDDDSLTVENSGPEVFTMSIRRHSTRRNQKLWCAIHVNENNRSLIICEFELEDDPDFPLVPINDKTPEVPEDTLNSEPTEDEFRESTEVQSRPLRVLRSARKRRGDAATMEVFNIMAQVQEQLAEAPNLEQFLKVLVGVVKELSGFHRVMIYQFDHSFNGKVVTELVDPRATKDLYKGHHFPASDIPRQAREMYKVNRVRLLYDRSQETARLVCRTVEDLETPLDLTHSYLRAMSPIHVKYLANMAVRSSMSISITAFNELWGLISCHAYGQKGTRVSFPIRKMCRLVGDSASRNIERLSYASRLQARTLINTSPTEKNPGGYIIASSEDLLKLFDADFGLLSIHDETKILGKLEGTQEALVLLEYLRMRQFTSVMSCHDVREDFPDLKYPPGFTVIGGLLLVPLSAGGRDFIVFFRKGQLKEVRWAGNPYEKFVKEGTEGYLEPRRSFKTWIETVVGKCREWTAEEVETGAVLCLVYGKFIEVWRQKEAALQNTQLTKLLLANSAHEIRTPLNAIINYLEIALEGSIDQETRDNLAMSHSASKSLIYVINDLLDLTKTQSSGGLVLEEAFDISTTFNEAAEPYAGDAKRKQIEYEVTEHPGLPEKVIGDQRKVRQAISNIIANAIKATIEGKVTAEIMVVARQETHVDIEVVVSDTGVGMSSQQLDALFVELEQAQSENERLVDETLSLPAKSNEGAQNTEKEQNKKTLGLGLAVVARVVRNMNGQVRLKSEEGKGSRFVVQFPFELPSSEKSSANALPATKALERKLGKSESAPALVEVKAPGEVTLVEKPRSSSLTEAPLLSRQNSAGSFESAHSRKSINSLQSAISFSSAQSGKSEADRLIEAMQEPHMVESPKGSGSTDTRKRPSSLRTSSHSRSGSSLRPRAHFQETASDKTPEHLRPLETSSSGYQTLANQRMPLRALKIPDDESVVSASETMSQASKTSTIDDSQHSESGNRLIDATHLRVLVAEDDPINSRIIVKRLSKMGHETFATVNGEECAHAYEERSTQFDVVLMDMQMPIVDGLTATKMIRSFEKTHSSRVLSSRAVMNGRIPIFAVSASLEEKKLDTYMDAGFDGWVLKPISFSRLAELMNGMVDDETRRKNVYKPGQWEQGGWFREGPTPASVASTTPNGRVPFTEGSAIVSDERDNEETLSSRGNSVEEDAKTTTSTGDTASNKTMTPGLDELSSPPLLPEGSAAVVAEESTSTATSASSTVAAAGTKEDVGEATSSTSLVEPTPAN